MGIMVVVVRKNRIIVIIEMNMAMIAISNTF